MKRLFGILALLALLTSSLSLTAGECTPYCDQIRKNYIEIEALYWETRHEPIYVAKRFNPSAAANGQVEEFDLEGTFNPGTRVRVGMRLCNTFADLSYLNFFSYDSLYADIGDFDQIAMPGDPGLFTPITAAKGSVTYLYQNVDGRFGHYFNLSKYLDGFLYGNARLVRVDFHNIVRGTPLFPIVNLPFIEDLFEQKGGFNGGGFGFGGGASYEICGGLSLRGNIGVTALYGETQLRKYRTQFVFEPSPVFPRQSFVKNLPKPQRELHALAAYDFKIGLNYLHSFCKCELEAEVGYSLDHYPNILRYASDAANTISRNHFPLFTCQNLSFGGLYFKLATAF